MNGQRSGNRKADFFTATMRVGERLTALVELLQIWRERAAERRSLAAFDDAALKDIGVSRAQALEEAAKPFWLP